MATLAEKIRSLQLSAGEIQKQTGWAAIMIEDYLNMIDSINTIVEDSDDKTDEIAALEAAVAALDVRVTTLEAFVVILDGRIDDLETEQEEQNQLINLTQSINKNKAILNKLNTRMDDLEQLIKN